MIAKEDEALELNYPRLFKDKVAGKVRINQVFNAQSKSLHETLQQEKSIASNTGAVSANSNNNASGGY